MRCPRGPGKGGLSNPGSSRPNLTQFTIRAISSLPSDCREWNKKLPYRASRTVEEGRTGVKPFLQRVATQMNVLFFGMRCVFSPPVLAAIISAGHEVVAVITPGPLGAPP